MYKFSDTIDDPRPHLAQIQTIYGGVNLDKAFDNFRTLNVSGRGFLAPDVKTTRKVGGNGVWIDEVSYPARPITVEAQVFGDQAEWVRTIGRALKPELTELEFSDEPGWIYKAIFDATPNRLSENQFAKVIELRFLCPDPAKMSRERVLLGNTGAVKLPESIIGDARIEQITVHLTASSDGIRVRNGSQNIFVGYRAEAGDQIDIYFGGRNEVALNSTYSLMPFLDLHSDFETFHAGAGDNISLVGSSGAIEVTYREVLF